MAGGQEAEERTGAVGPVETPYESGHPDYLGPPPTVLSEAGGSAVERRFGLWWQGIGARRRRLVLLAGCALTVGLLWGGAVLGRPAPAPPPPPPAPSLPVWPVQAATVTYAGLVPGSFGTGNRFTVMLTFTDTSNDAVALLQVAQPYTGITLTTGQLLPLRIVPGIPQTLWVEMQVQNCSHTPRADDLPFIDVTLSNARAIQTQSEILGEPYARDLGTAIRRACPPRPGSSGNPAGSAVPAAP